MATDFFAVLELPRKPWLPVNEVQESFQRLAGQRHPDAQGGSDTQFTELNEAWQTLRSPVARLRHYLDLEFPESAPSNPAPPPELGDLFLEIAELRQQITRHSAQWNEARSPLTQALLQPARISLRQRAEALAGDLAARSLGLETSLKSVAPDPQLLRAALAQLVFLERWQAQVRESQLAVA